jgi:uncharacterized protein (TIGR02271 family)
MKVWNKFNCRNLTLAAAALATLAFVGGCCTRSTGGTAYYSAHPRTYAYAGGTAEQTQPATTTGENTSTVQGGATSMVVPLYQESVNVGKREVEAGQVRLKKIVKTETVNVPVELRHEEVVIDRNNNISGSPQNQVLAQRFQEGETTIQLKREEPVIEKQTQPTGEIVVQTKYATQQQNVQAQVRKEDIDIAKQGNTENVIIGQNVHASYSSSGGAESPGGQTSAEVSSSGPITDVAVFTSSSTDVSRLANRPVELSGLKVRRIIGDKVVVLSGENGREIYVISTQERPKCSEGDTVTITGTVKETSSNKPELTGDAAQALSSQRYYIEATKIEPAK